MKKLLILAMSCNQPFFLDQETNIKKLYAKDIIDNKYPNIDFYIYTASYDDKFHINKQEHKLYVPADDSLEGTFEKTQQAFKLITHLNIEYDYILRTNCSTYINVELINRFINEITLDNKKIYTGNIYLSDNATGPYNWLFYGVGNALLLSKFWINVIIKSNPLLINTYVNNKNKPYYKIDDNTIGLIVNDYALKHNIDMYELWQSFKFPLINHIPKEAYNYIIIPYRQYNMEQTRENEEYISQLLHKQIKNYDISNVNIDDILNDQVIHILDFDRKMHSVVTREFTNKFLDVMSLPKYITKIHK